MALEPPLIQREGLVCGRMLRRYKRFFADIEMEGGETVTAHTTNTGSMKSCWEVGDRVLLEPAANPERKLRWTLLAVEWGSGWVGVETGIPNRVVAEAARRDRLPGLPGLREVRTEVRYGAEKSRIDVWARDAKAQETFIEVKNTTLKDGAYALFPDAVTERGTKHLRELQGMVDQGHRAVIAFFIHRTDVERFDAAREVDPGYAETLLRAADRGVQVLPLQVEMKAGREPSGLWTLAWRLPGLLPWVRR